MYRSTLVFILVLACSSNAANAAVRRSGDVHSSLAGTVSPDSHDTIDNAIAGALISAISEQLGGRSVDLKLGKTDVQPLNTRERSVSGTGSLRIDGDDDWMGFRFKVLYDSVLDSTGDPEVSIGGVTAGERDMPNDVQLVQQLDDQVVGALSIEFRQPSVRLQLDKINTVEAGNRYLRINANGIADFGRDGSSNAQIEALYDRVRSQWLRVHYELGDGAERSSRDIPLLKR